jgi:polysaccharide pyruvyl transferase WcaK-like protein
LTAEYQQRVTPAEAASWVEDVLRLALASDQALSVELLGMHYFPVGFDDRGFGARLAKAIASDRVHLVSKPLSPVEILESMASAQHCLVMRFHSVVFAQTVGAPFTAIDYTSGGKIDAFLRERGREDCLFSFDSSPVEIVNHIGLSKLAVNRDFVA